MVIEYKPKDKDYEGVIKFDAPSYPQRLKYVKACNIKTETNEKGEATVSHSLDNVEAMIIALENAKKHVKHVDVKRKSDGKEYKSYDDLLEDADEICNEIFALLLNRPSLGKS